MTTVMVELATGYGDGYAVVEADDAGTPVVTGQKVDLLDSHTRVPAGAVRRIIGPPDCPEAVRVRARRYTRPWIESGFVALATDAELSAAMGHATEPDTYRAMTALRDRYRQAK